MTAITVVGTGAMGSAIALNLIHAGHAVSVWNRSESPTAALAAAGATVIHDPKKIITTPIILSVLADDAAVRSVFLDSGALESATEDAVHVNLATISPHFAAELAREHAVHGVEYVAAPMFGGLPVARAGALNIVTAGATEALAAVADVLGDISAKTWQVGDQPSHANVVKVAGQVLIASAIQSMSEAVSIVEDSGIDARTAVKLFTSTITPGPVYTNYGGLIADRSYQPPGFTPILGRKDVDLARSTAGETTLRLPLADLLSDLLTEAIDSGHSSDDWAILAELQRHRHENGDRP